MKKTNKIFPLIILLLLFAACSSVKDVEVEPFIDLEQLQKNIVFPDVMSRINEGKVILKVLIGADSKIDTVVVEETTSVLFNQAAIDAVKKTDFKAGTVNGKPVACWINIPIIFQLNK